MLTHTIILETPRLILRKMEMSDAPFFYQLNSNPVVTKYTGDGAFKNIEEAEAITEYVINQYKQFGYGRWMVIEKETNSPIGWCGLKFHPDENFVDLGYRFLQSHWGKGYATESSKACADYGFNVLKLTRIVGRVSTENKASINVLQKIGMTYLKDENCDGEDTMIFEISKK